MKKAGQIWINFKLTVWFNIQCAESEHMVWPGFPELLLEYKSAAGKYHYTTKHMASL